MGNRQTLGDRLIEREVTESPLRQKYTAALRQATQNKVCIAGRMTLLVGVLFCLFLLFMFFLMALVTHKTMDTAAGSEDLFRDLGLLANVGLVFSGLLLLILIAILVTGRIGLQGPPKLILIAAWFLIAVILLMIGKTISFISRTYQGALTEDMRGFPLAITCILFLVSLLMVFLLMYRQAQQRLEMRQQVLELELQVAELAEKLQEQAPPSS